MINLKNDFLIIKANAIYYGITKTKSVILDNEKAEELIKMSKMTYGLEFYIIGNMWIYIPVLKSGTYSIVSNGVWKLVQKLKIDKHHKEQINMMIKNEKKIK